MNIQGNNDVNYIIYVGRVNKECEKIQLDELMPDILKCLIFTQGLTGEKDAEVRTRILTKLEQNQDGSGC